MPEVSLKLYVVRLRAHKQNKVIITRLNMWSPPFHVLIDSGHMLVGQHDLQNSSFVYYGINAKLSGGKCGLYLNSKNNDVLAAGPLKFFGGDSHISGTGIHIGRGGGIALVSSITVAPSKNCPRLIELPRQNRTQPQLFVFGECARNRDSF